MTGDCNRLFSKRTLHDLVYFFMFLNTHFTVNKFQRYRTKLLEIYQTNDVNSH